MTASTTRQEETRPRPGQEPGGASPAGGLSVPPGAQRPLAVTGAIAACAAAGAGLAMLTLIAAVGWIAAPRASVGAGLPGVLRTAIQLWLVGHHVGFTLKEAGPVGLLPLGLVALPGAALWRSGRWVVRTGGIVRLRHVGYAAVALALPYGLLTGALAVASRTPVSAPSPFEAAWAGCLLAFVAGGLGGLRALAPWGRLIGLLPDRARCLAVGVTGSLASLVAVAAVIIGISLIVHAHEFRLISVDLSAGLVGSVLLVLAALAYLPNAVLWAIAYMLGPGFAVGAGTVVAPTGSVIGALPMFPMLAALPPSPPGSHVGGPGPASLAMLTAPFLAGAFGGLLTVRAAPSFTLEIAPLWGLACGVLSGAVLGALAALSGGSLGHGAMSVTGPSGWQIGLVAALELGVSAAIAAGLSNWLLLRRLRAHTPGAAGLASGGSTAAPGTGHLPGAEPAPAGTDPDLADPAAADPSGHRIYLDPWAADKAADKAAAQAGPDREPPADDLPPPFPGGAAD